MAAALDPYVANHSFAGAVTEVGTKDKVLDLEAIGYADLATKRPMQANTLFWIASQSKTMTAAAFLILVDEGKVSEDDPVEKYIPAFHEVMVAPAAGQTGLQKPTHPILIRELLSHNSGLDFAVPGDQEPFDRLSLAQRVDLYAKHPLLCQPGTEFHYSNAGINTVGRIIEIVSGMPYAQFLDTRLFAPLGMTDTTFYPDREQIARLATAYKADEAKTGLVAVPISQLHQPFDDPQRTPLPAGGLFSTAGDCLKFMQMIAANGQHDGKSLLSANAIQAMERKETSVRTGPAYGFAMFLDAGPRVGHNGAFKTNMYLFPKTGLITIFMVQQAGDFANGAEAKIVPAFAQVAEEMMPK